MTVRRGIKGGDATFESAEDGTIYWTLSLYIEAAKVGETLGLGDDARVDPGDFRTLQLNHKPSLALAYAIDPLMNDIADRETLGEVQEFLLAATAEEPGDMDEAREIVRRHDQLTFQVPETISWTTEGIRFEASPAGLDRRRLVKLRRFWLSHNDGALSYHMSFSHHYGSDPSGRRTGYDPSTLYFLSILQKLAAPKEYTLSNDALERGRERDNYVDVFDSELLGIAPLDEVMIEHGFSSNQGRAIESDRFWPFVEKVFETDARVLLDRLAKQLERKPPTTRDGLLRETLLDLTPFIEVPGLKAPKSRFMFMLHDERLFKRLMPLDPVTNEAVSRKVMVQAGCYEFYSRLMKTRIRQSRDEGVVRLDRQFWEDVLDRRDYESDLASGAFVRKRRQSDRARIEGADGPEWVTITEPEELAEAMRKGECFERSGPDAPPTPWHIPAFEAGRTDCLEYLFLAGFNQNIIDFMNQDTSEILDSIDPIYPDSSDQSSDRFFVRYANHRAMITYVPKSRSLETGNDYVGACPYAFLIHVLALHNEFLARGHEAKTMARIREIEALLANHRSQPGGTRIDTSQEAARLARAEIAINEAKLAEFSQFERFRYANPFRYETERAVFRTLEELRGTSRKKDALALAIKSLEDHASDLSRRQQKIVDDAAAKRGQQLNILLGMTGFFGAGQMFYWIGEKTAGAGAGGPPEPTRLSTPFGPLGPSVATGNVVLAATEVVMMLTLAFFVAMVLWALWPPSKRFLRRLSDLSFGPRSDATKMK